jgi:hypothetical protein
MTPDTISVEFLTAAAGVLLSLGFSYIPELQALFNQLDGNRKRLVMLSLLALTSLSIFGMSCLGWSQALGLPQATCSQVGALGQLKIFVLAVIANQSTFLITPKATRP